MSDAFILQCISMKHMNKYYCEYCKKSYKSYDAYLLRHDCKATKMNRMFTTCNKIVNMLEDLYKNGLMDYNDFNRLTNKVSHDTLIQVKKVMNQ